MVKKQTVRTVENKLPAQAFELSGFNEETQRREDILSYKEEDAAINQDFSVHSSKPLYSTDFLAILAHRLWTHWSQHIAEEEDISEDRVERWQGLWVPFDQLSSEMKEKDQDLVERFLDEKPDYNENSEGENQ